MGKKNEGSAKQKATLVYHLLKEAYPEARCSLFYKNPFELLCATILSAQCTDDRVNQVTPALFKVFPNSQTMSAASIEVVEQLIQSTGFYKNKARSLVEMSKVLVEKFDGEVPSRMEDLVELRGVGRKTANVVLGNAFGVPGFVVDTHVGRLCRRMGFTKQTNPEIVEKEMSEIFNVSVWVEIGHLMIAHGRAMCKARGPLCKTCFLNIKTEVVCSKMGVLKK